MTSKQRAFLRSMCNTLPVVLFIGKEGITQATCNEADAALEAREIIKCSVQKGAPLTAKDAIETLCQSVGAEPVQCIGSKFSIYRPKKEDPVILLP